MAFPVKEKFRKTKVEYGPDVRASDFGFTVTRAKMRHEGDVKREVKKLLDKHGYFWWMPPANGYGRSGISDINALRNGVFLAIETKFGKRKPTPMQLGFLESIASARGYGFVVNEKRIEWLATFLDAFDRSTEAVQQGGKPSPEDGAMMLNAIKILTTELGHEDASAPAVGQHSAARS